METSKKQTDTSKISSKYLHFRCVRTITKLLLRAGVTCKKRLNDVSIWRVSLIKYIDNQARFSINRPTRLSEIQLIAELIKVKLLSIQSLIVSFLCKPQKTNLWNILPINSENLLLWFDLSPHLYCSKELLPKR